MNAALLQRLARIDELTASVEALSASVAALSAERDQYRKLYMELLERCALLERGILAGKKAERFEANTPQLTLAVLETVLAQQQPPGEQGEQGEPGSSPSPEVPEKTAPKPGEEPEERRRPTGRRRLSEHAPHLPIVEIEVVPDEVKREGLDAFTRVGEEVRELIERRPASLVVVRVVRPKFVRKGPGGAEEESSPEGRPLIEEPPELPIGRGLAGPGLLAYTTVLRFDDHMPLHRQERIFAREGLDISRSTICDWHERLAELLEPLVQAMRADALTQPYLCIDATGVLVQAKKQCTSGHFWVLVAPSRHVIYGFSHKHDSAAVDRLLAGYKGYLVADAHSVYDHLYNSGDIIEVGCWCHSRRYFCKSLTSEPDHAQHALSLIRELYKIERSIKNDPRKEREAVRNKQSRPIVDAFLAWCDQQAAVVLDETPLSKAVGYVRNQRLALARFLEDGRLPLDNNISELMLRHQKVGSNNWLFIGSDDGARANTVFVSLIASCRLHGIEPWAYLRDLLCLFSSWPRKRILELAPAFWKQTLQQHEAQQLLEANVFRAVSLPGHPPDK